MNMTAHEDHRGHSYHKHLKLFTITLADFYNRMLFKEFSNNFMQCIMYIYITVNTWRDNHFRLVIVERNSTLIKFYELTYVALSKLLR